MKKASIIVIFAVFIQKAGAYSSGAPTSICTSMSPVPSGMTGAAAQGSASPYVLNVSLTSMNVGNTLVGMFFSFNSAEYFIKHFFHPEMSNCINIYETWLVIWYI